jgi:hypothetical protein
VNGAGLQFEGPEAVSLSPGHGSNDRRMRSTLSGAFFLAIRFRMDRLGGSLATRSWTSCVMGQALIVSAVSIDPLDAILGGRTAFAYHLRKTHFRSRTKIILWIGFCVLASTVMRIWNQSR